MEIELSGPHGNAFYLMSYAEKLGYDLGLSREERDIIIRDMKSGDYKNLLKVFIENFGEVVTLTENGQSYCIEE